MTKKMAPATKTEAARRGTRQPLDAITPTASSLTQRTVASLARTTAKSRRGRIPDTPACSAVSGKFSISFFIKKSESERDCCYDVCEVLATSIIVHISMTKSSGNSNSPRLLSTATAKSSTLFFPLPKSTIVCAVRMKERGRVTHFTYAHTHLAPCPLFQRSSLEDHLPFLPPSPPTISENNKTQQKDKKLVKNQHKWQKHTHTHHFFDGCLSVFLESECGPASLLVHCLLQPPQISPSIQDGCRAGGVLAGAPGRYSI